MDVSIVEVVNHFIDALAVSGRHNEYDQGDGLIQLAKLTDGRLPKKAAGITQRLPCLNDRVPQVEHKRKREYSWVAGIFG